MLLNCDVEDSWESLGLQGDPTSSSKGDQSWVFTGRTDVEAETPICWPPDVKSWLIWKDPDAGKGEEGVDRGEDGWMASPTQWRWVWVTLGVGFEQGCLACCGSWGRKESDTTEWLNWTELMLGKDKQLKLICPLVVLLFCFASDVYMCAKSLYGLCSLWTVVYGV